MSTGSFAVLAVILVLLFLAVRHLVKKGSCGYHCGSEGCSECCSKCHSEMYHPKEH